MNQADHDVADGDRLALVDLLDRAFDDAVVRVGEVVRTVRIANEVIAIRFAGGALVPALMRALGPVVVAPEIPPTATIDVWDTVSTGRPLPLLVRDLLRAHDAAWLGDRGPRGELQQYSVGSVRAAYYGPGLLSTFNRSKRRGTFWINDHGALPWYEPGSPFRVLFDWILGGPTRHLVHAGAIHSSSGGVLLGGAGGSGKSTTALACLGAPDLRYVSDDYVTIGLEPEPVAWNMYATAKVKSPADLGRFPRLRDHFTALDIDGEAEHPVLFVHEHLRSSLAGSTPLRALVFPRYLALDECTIDAVQPDIAFKLLAPSTIQQVPTDTAAAMQFMRSLTTRVPAFRLGLPRDVELIPAAIHRIIANA